MDTKSLIKGIHHLTATVDGAQEDYDFYTKVLGLRLVKKTVNFDNNKVYHFYYGNEVGEPSTIMTTFPYRGQGVREGVKGTGQVAVTTFSAPLDSLSFWKERLATQGVSVEEDQRFSQNYLCFEDPSGLGLEIVGEEEDPRVPWTTSEITSEVAIRGIHSVTLSIAELASSENFMLDEFGFNKIGREGKISRFAAQGGGAGKYLEIREDEDLEKGKNGIGTVHHVAWRVENDEALLAMRKRLADELGFKVTEVKDRKYFHSIYFRMPGQVLFEIATIPPGFMKDESIEGLGQELKLPEWEEVNRPEIEANLPKVQY